MRGFLSTFFVFVLGSLALAQNSVLKEGTWYKIPIAENGIYKLSYNYLQNAGLPVESLDPQKIRIFGNSGGMLPQGNAVSRPFGLVENAILVQGEDDGSFDPEDFVLFYAFGPHDHQYLDDDLIFEFNLYAKENFYFITYDGEVGERIVRTDNLGSELPQITTFNDFAHYEIDETNLLISGREWYGERFDLTTSRDFIFDFEGISPNSVVKITSNVMTQSFDQSSFDISVNGSIIGSQSLAGVPNFLDPPVNNPFRYSIKGIVSHREFMANTSQLPSSENLTVTIDYNKNNSDRSIGYLNYLEVEVERTLRRYGVQTIFRSLTSMASPSVTYEIGNVEATDQIWDITERERPLNQPFELAGSVAVFGAPSAPLREYVIFDPDLVSEPASTAELISNQDLKGLPAAELLIVTHPDFLSEAQRLADFRRNNDNMSVEVATTSQIFNEFSSGKQDVTAIRDFARYHYDKSNTLKYLLLFGKGSYDYKDVLDNNKNFVPIYESYNTLLPLDTYASDDYYGFMEEDEGEWLEERDGNHTLDVGVGRLPVTTLEEAQTVVNKIIQYDDDAQSLGGWRNELVFVADDGDLNLHQDQANDLTVLVDTSHITFNNNKIFLDAYPQISRPNGQTSPKARKALQDAIEKGALVVNYTGHGGEIGWMQEQVLDLFLIDDLSNRYKLPLFVTATCEFGRHDDPKRVSGGELVVTTDRGGAIAIVTTGRPVAASSNFELNKAFYNAIFEQENNEYLRLGDVFRITKNNSFDLARDTKKVGNRNFSLLGDPSLRLAYPQEQVVITNIQENGISTDTLKALAQTTVFGEVRNAADALLEGFNGIVEITVFDNDIDRTTLGDGNDNIPFTYQIKENKLFKGTATVANGRFQVDFVVPKNISQRYEYGKISTYASDVTAINDASGANVSVAIGGTTNNPVNDTKGPEIQLFVGDTISNKLTGISHNTMLFARLSDENGINISGFGTSNSISATLDGDEVFILNDFYSADKDEYRRGWVVFALDNLEAGRHTIELQAGDTYNNISTEQIEFFVADPNSLLVSGLKNSPNPVTDYTTISFNHNRSGDDLEVNLQIVSFMGELVRDLTFDVDDSPPVVELFEWDGSGISNKKLTQGIYLYRISVRSLQDGAKGQGFQKLILIK